MMTLWLRSRMDELERQINAHFEWMLRTVKDAARRNEHGEVAVTVFLNGDREPRIEAHSLIKRHERIAVDSNDGT